MKKEKYSKIIIIVMVLIIIGLITYIIINTNSEKQNTIKPLPKPEVTTGLRGDFGIDKNINESNIDNYLNRTDIVYRDVRMLKDPANYEEIGGDHIFQDL